MFDHDKYKKNLDSIDKHGIKDVNVNKAVSYSGDVNIIKKKKCEDENTPDQPLAAAIVGINNTAAPLPKNPEFYTAWTDIDALELFLSSKPTCYLILSKPGAGAYSLGEAMSKKLNCIHLCPKNMITDEIEQNSATGKCIDINMKNNKAITFDIFFKILKIKLESPAIQHRGYIISGFPLVTSSRDLKYFINTLNGEEAVEVVGDLLFDIIANLKKNKPKKREADKSSDTSTASDAEAPGEGDEEVEEEPEPEEELLEEEEEELKVELPKFLLNPCADIIHPTRAYYNSKKIVLLQQLNDLFSLNLKPDIVIYLSCPDKDLVTKKSHKYINYKNNQHIVKPFIATDPLEVRWPVRYTTSDYIGPFDSHTFNSKYYCRQPINFEDRSIEQMCNYKHDIYPFIDKKLQDFDPKYVIKLDARITVHEMMHNITETLLTMPVMPVIIPEPLFIEETPDDMEEFWKSIEELNVIHSDVVTFNRSASLWAERCPVELYRRLSVRGNPKLAVKFLKYVYLMASLDNLISFCRNPRPYLKLKYLEPTCRIIVIGTKCSGKTFISECLSWLFDTPIINYTNFVQTETQKKYDNYAKTILSEIVATIEDARFAKWQSAEIERFAHLDEWCKLTIATLNHYIPLLKVYIRLTTPKKQVKVIKAIEAMLEMEEIESIEEVKGNDGIKGTSKIEETKGIEEDEEIGEIEEIEGVEEIQEEPTPSLEFMNNFNTIKSHISFLPFLDDIDACEKALSIKVITQYAPKHLITPKEKPALPILGDDDVISAIAAYIVANELQTEIEPTTEEIMNALTIYITSLDSFQCEKYIKNDKIYGKYIIDGFPSDPENWGILTESKLLPDYTVVLIENREIDPELIENYKDIEKHMKNYQERYMLADDALIKTKLKIKNPPDFKGLDMAMILDDVMKGLNFSIDKTENTENFPETDPWTSFAENTEKFKEDWDNIKIKLEEYNKCFIDVELENKSDVQVVEEVLLKIRKSYFISCEVIENDELDEEDEEDETPKNIMTYNNPQNFGETGIYCPISFYKYGVLWEGKPEFSVKFDSKVHRLCKEECLELLQKDIMKYQSYNKPFKALPPLRICVIGCIGSGKTTISKFLAKELGLTHIDFSEVINDLLMPRNFKKVGRRYENTFTDVSIDDEAVVEFQMDEDDENLISNILSNEIELRKMVYNYFERGAPLLPQLMQRMITKFWFQDPFVNTGFVLDGYPRLPTDVEDMTACYCIPDLIIEIEGSSENSLTRLSSNMFKTWKMQLSEAKEKARQKLDIDKKEWMDFLTKNIVAKLICDEILENMFFSTEPIKGLSKESVILDAHPSGSVIDTNLFKTFNEMIQVFPEPVDLSEWEKPDEVRERIEGRIEGVYESDDENIQALKDLLLEQRIKIVSVDGNKSLTKVTRVTLSKLTNLRNRCESFFEKTSIISPDIAEMVLIEGFCFLSKFNRICPVYNFENPNAIHNVYGITKLKNKVFPIIHRSYVYFICGEENVKKFRTNPLKYVSCNNIREYKDYPLRIGVIGAPKSGRSCLSAKLAKRYGLICLSRGIAVRNVLNNKSWTELAAKMLSVITLGDCINSDYVMAAVQAMAMDHRTITNGFVFDGFPDTAPEAMELVKSGLYPNIVFDISTDIENVVQHSQNEVYYDMLKMNPPYSSSFIENRYRKWQDKSYNVRKWINSDYQNIYVLDGNKSRWQCLQDAVDVINDFVPKVHYYLANVKRNIVPAHVMCISNEIFEQRMSNFKNMCPLCLRKKEISHNMYPVDKKGVVQYRNKFYWICSKHMSRVLQYPNRYLLKKNICIPELPVIVKTINMTIVYENGICIVTYAEHLPGQMIVVGTNKHAACFHGNTYLFCSKTCLEKFMKKPHMYYDIKVFNEARGFPALSLKSLPNIGYLEQTVGNLITEACCSVNVFRPKYPGLSFQLSGLLYIAFYLKTHNPLIDKAALPMYLKASQKFDARCKLLTHVALFLRSMDNPFANYPACCGELRCDSGTVKKPSTLSSDSTKMTLYI